MLTLVPCFSAGSFVHLQRTKWNCNTTSTDSKHDRWSQKSTFCYFPHLSVTFKGVKASRLSSAPLLCRFTSAHANHTTCRKHRPDQWYSSNDHSQSGERDLNLCHVTHTVHASMVQSIKARHLEINVFLYKPTLFSLALFVCAKSQHLDIKFIERFLVPLADTNNDGGLHRFIKTDSIDTNHH